MTFIEHSIRDCRNHVLLQYGYSNKKLKLLKKPVLSDTSIQRIIVHPVNANFS